MEELEIIPHKYFIRVLFRTISVIFRTNPVICRTNSVIFYMISCLLFTKEDNPLSSKSTSCWSRHAGKKAGPQCRSSSWWGRIYQVKYTSGRFSFQSSTVYSFIEELSHFPGVQNEIVIQSVRIKVFAHLQVSEPWFTQLHWSQATSQNRFSEHSLKKIHLAIQPSDPWNCSMFWLYNFFT